MKRCGFTMFDGVHTAVGNFYSFIQRDKRSLQTERKETTECPEHRMPAYSESLEHLLFSFWLLTLMVTVIWTTVKWFYRPLPVGKPTPPAVPPLLRSSSSAWRSALLLSPDQSTHNLEDNGESSQQTTQVTKPNLTDLIVTYCRRLLGSAQKLEEWRLKEKKVWIRNRPLCNVEITNFGSR